MQAYTGNRGITALLLNPGIRWGEWSPSHPVHFILGQEPWHQLNRRLYRLGVGLKSFGQGTFSCFCWEFNPIPFSLQIIAKQTTFSRPSVTRCAVISAHSVGVRYVEFGIRAIISKGAESCNERGVYSRCRISMHGINIYQVAVQ
jgi:hypothetical protein